MVYSFHSCWTSSNEVGLHFGEVLTKRRIWVGVESTCRKGIQVLVLASGVPIAIARGVGCVDARECLC